MEPEAPPNRNAANVSVGQGDLESGGQTRPRAVPEFLLNDTLYLFFLRAVVASSLMTSGFGIYAVVVLGRSKKSKSTWKWALPYTVWSLMTVIHHLGTAFGPTRFPLPRWIDLPWTLLEAAAYLGAVVYLTRVSNVLGAQYFPRYGVAALVGIWALGLSVSLLFALKVTYVITKHIPQQSVAREGDASWKYPARSMFGRRMWGRGVLGEPKWTTLLRGILALLAVCALVGYGVYQAIMMPIAEMGKIPYRTYRSDGLDWDTTTSVLPTLKYRALLLWSPHPQATRNLIDAVTVTARYREIGGATILQQNHICTLSTAHLAAINATRWDLAVAKCPQPPRATDIWWDFPNFDINVNFTALLGPPGAASADRVSDSLRVYLGFTDHLDRIYAKTDPVSLFPGVNLLSVAKLELLQTLIPASLGTFGLESYENYMIASIIQTISNPLVDPASDRGAGTLGFTVQSAIGGWTTLQDYRSKSVLSGLSALGGLGSLFSAILALLLGTSLVQAVFRVKPNNPFGFLHGSDGLRKAFQRDYPELGDDVDRYRKRRGFSKYIIDTLVDVETLGFKADAPNASGPAPPLTQVQHHHSRKEDEDGGSEERE